MEQLQKENQALEKENEKLKKSLEIIKEASFIFVTNEKREIKLTRCCELDESAFETEEE